jgi:hypothetical protein
MEIIKEIMERMEREKKDLSAKEVHQEYKDRGGQLSRKMVCREFAKKYKTKKIGNDYIFVAKEDRDIIIEEVKKQFKIRVKRLYQEMCHLLDNLPN